eukprot:TRINITY_DN5506_c0_g1_i1.p1 TRINITY_DN5506_c0_g1~~TRINITY_DN5506_c0_g1_i1.p1  ORF type:complete len:128 (+),score=16.61 TRINITY_DN5506_c0_g1_i1:19-402(+)
MCSRSMIAQTPSSIVFFFLMIRRPPRSTLSSSSAASDVYKRQELGVELPQKQRHQRRDLQQRKELARARESTHREWEPVRISHRVESRRSVRLQPALGAEFVGVRVCLLYTSPSPRDRTRSRMPSSA